MEKESTYLHRKHWITLGLEILINKGIEAVRVEPLAKLLNVTRGSFYWHFKSRDELLRAMLEEWENSNTDGVISRVEAIENNPENKLLRLFEIAAQDDDKLEKAMRIWAANDIKAAEMIARVDQRRLSYLLDLFLQLDFSDPDAKVRAQITYSVRLGWLMMSTSIDPAGRLEEIRFVHKILTQHNRRLEI